MQKLKIGFLIPYSGIFKNLRNDFKQGVLLAMEQMIPNREIEMVDEFIQTGGQSFVENALHKLALFDHVDVIIGIVGTKVTQNCLDLINKHRVPVIIANLGGFVPTYQFRSDYLFYTSLDLWKSEWSMGKWAQQQYGADPCVSLSYYEAGYNMHECYRYGLHAAGATYVKLNFIKGITASPDTLPLINQLQLLMPNHTHAMLSGKEGQQFLYHYRQSKIASRTALSVNPFMADECLETSDPSVANLTSAITWTCQLETDANQYFIQTYEKKFDQQPIAYSMLGYEAGLCLSTAIDGHEGSKITRDSLTTMLAATTCFGPRGGINLKTTSYHNNHPVYIRISQINRKTGLIENKIIDQDPGISWEHPEMLQAAYDNSSGWQNPYLCV